MELDQLERDIREVKETLEKNKRELNELWFCYVILSANYWL
jgi:hypothetical protein